MTAGDDTFPGLMARVFAGQKDAVDELLRRYEPYLLRAIRKRLNKRLRSKFDSLDFVQDVWASFFADRPQQLTFQQPEELVAFLTEVARNKLVEVVRQRLYLQKFNLLREQSLYDAQVADAASLAAYQETPSESAMHHEEWDRFLQSQPPVYRRILLLLREGRTPAEIAQQMGVSERTVFRASSRLTPGLSR
jgi:RNA polymerase sigma-70 factor (ECF subfamily)